MPHKIWVKYGDGQSVKVIFNEGDVDDLKKAIKYELPEQFKNISTNQITLRKQGEEVDLDPELEVDGSFVNNSKTPVQIFVKSQDVSVDDKVQKEDWKWPCFEEKVDGRWGGIVRKPMFNTQEEGFIAPFKVIYFNSKKLYKTYLELNSQPLIEYLQDIFRDSSNNNIFNETPSVKAQDLFHIMPILENKHDEEKTSDLKNHLKHLIRFLKHEYNQTIEIRKKFSTNKVVSFNMLWVFYTAGLEVYYRCNMSNQQIGGTISSAKVKVESRNEKEVLIFQIKIKVVDYDGHGFKYCSVTRNIEEFEGDRSFSDLPVVLLNYAEKSFYLKELIHNNGKLFFDLAKGTNYKSYEGSLMRWKQVGGCMGVEKIKANGRVMIDHQSFATMNPDYPMYNASPPNKCDIELLGENGYLKKNDEYFAPALVYGFSFALKEWGQFNVTNFKEINFSIEAFNDLVMIPEKKDILKGLLEQHITNSNKGVNSIDPINNKGKGCIFLCHGPPGTGKTLTAESVAEELKRPLWMLSVHELGMSPSNLERQLVNVLDIAFVWNAVLLLDEADIYLEKRDTVNLDRNAMTCIFLRQLEYYQGILFLTTNRVMTFDPAFCSRISMFFHYPTLNLDEKAAIWKKFIKKAKIDLNADDFIKHNLNGREIRNVIHTAKMLAKNHNENITAKHVNQVVEIIQQFQKDMNEVCY